MTPTSCQACGGRLATRYPRVLDPLTREGFAVLGCEQCGLGHTSPQPEDLAPYYPEAYYGGRHGWTKAYCARRRVRVLSKAAESPGLLLDVGCGEGDFLRAAQRRGWRVVGTEIGAAAQAARAAGLEVRDSLAAASDKAPYTAITLWHSLEHLCDPREALERARQLLVPGGFLIVAVPDAGSLQARVFGPRWFHLDVPRHLYHFDAHSLAGLLARAGFGVVRRFPGEVEYDLLGWTQSALNTVLPRPNLLFQQLTKGIPPRRSARAGIHLGLGSLAGAATLPGWALGSFLGHPGTLVFLGQKRERRG